MRECERECEQSRGRSKNANMKMKDNISEIRQEGGEHYESST